MKPERAASLQATRASLVAQLDAHALQEPSIDGSKKSERALKNWAYERDEMARLVEKLDSLLAPRSAAAPAAPAAAPKAEGAPEPLQRRAIDVARIAKGKRAEMRVSINEWSGVRNVDVRLWYMPKGGCEWVPSRKGVAIDAGKLDALVDALLSAKQHLHAPL